VEKYCKKMGKNIIKKIKLGIQTIKIIKNWPIYILNYFGLIKKRYLIYNFRSGIRLKVRSNTESDPDREVVSNIFFLKGYLLPEKNIVIRPSDTIIDIGAHIGAFSVLAAHKAKKGLVYCYEPEKNNFNLLRQNIKLNKFGNVKAFNFAVLGKKGKKNLFLGDRSTTMYSMYSKTKEKSVKVNCITLKGIFISIKIKKCNFLKLDCEGAEFEILYNTPKKYLKKIEKISMEFHDLDKKKLNHNYLKKFLEKHGFKVEITRVSKAAQFLMVGDLYAKL